MPFLDCPISNGKIPASKPIPQVLEESTKCVDRGRSLSIKSRVGTREHHHETREMATGGG